MHPTTSDILRAAEVACILLLWFGPPVFACAASLIYFHKANTLPLPQRVLVSAHGAALAWIYLAGVAVAALGLHNPVLAVPFGCLFSIPLALGLYAFIRWNDGGVHLLLIGEFLCAVWIFFIGTMAVTGDWL